MENTVAPLLDGGSNPAPSLHLLTGETVEIGDRVYHGRKPWTVSKIGDGEITVKDENGMVWANVSTLKFSLYPPPPVEEAIKVEKEQTLISTRRKRRPIWENPERRKDVLDRLVSNPSAYTAAGWLLRNRAHFHLSITPEVKEEGRLEDFVHSEILNILDSDISVSSDLTQGPSFTATVGGLRPPEHVSRAFKNIGVADSKYYNTGTTVQKWGFVYDFMMVNLGIGFNHNIDLRSIANKILNPACRDAFMREINGVK